MRPRHGRLGWESPLPATPAELSPLGEPLHRAYQAAIAFRRRNPWLATATLEVLHRENAALSYRCQAPGAEAEFLVDLDAGTLTVRQGGSDTVLG